MLSRFRNRKVGRFFRRAAFFVGRTAVVDLTLGGVVGHAAARPLHVRQRALGTAGAATLPGSCATRSSRCSVAPASRAARGRLLEKSVRQSPTGLIMLLLPILVGACWLAVMVLASVD